MDNKRQLPPFVRGYGRPEFVALQPVRGVIDLIEGARSRGLKWPKLWLQLPDGTPIRVTVAGDNSRTPGYLMLTDGKPFGQSQFFGRISPAGIMEPGRDGSQEQRDELAKLMQRLAADPASTAAAFGHMTGSCTFCGLPLTDERSVAVGYGQTCAKKYGMPYQTKRASSLRLLED
jgi:hypothetical protein